MRCVIVSHTHWDREWYRTFQEFRARLVDVVDRLLELCAADPGYRFLLDGQTIVLEDYVELRPERREELARAIRSGQVAIGPWYVQPDSLLPSGESHVRNLLEGRRVGEGFGSVSRIAYTPDSFGHPAQYPQIFRGFGFDAFSYTRGHGNELESLASEYRWIAPDGSDLLACHQARSYSAAADLPDDLEAAADQLKGLALTLAERATSENVLLLNGTDHRPAEARTRELADCLAKATGWDVQRGFIEDFVDRIGPDLQRYRGELIGGRMAPLLPGVWSTRTYLKLHNRACETALEGWAEPWAALGRMLGLADERPALRVAWREVLRNQAHDSICGCSRDAVHEQMLSRYATAEELARETTARLLQRIAGAGTVRESSWSDAWEVAVFNPSPYPRTDVVRFPIDPEPYYRASGARASLHPLVLGLLQSKGLTADGEAVRVDHNDPFGQPIERFPATDIEFVVRDVPALGWTRVSLQLAEKAPDVVDAGREIENGILRVVAEDDGNLTVLSGDATYVGLGALEDLGDRGDSYDYDPVEGGDVSLEGVAIQRTRHESGLQSLEVVRLLRVPSGLAENRSERSEESTIIRVASTARLVPGVPRVDLTLEIDNTAKDHRLRMLFPTGRPVREFLAASTFDVATRTPGPRNESDWVQEPPATFPHQGWISANGLTVVAPGLPEAEVRPDGTIAVTLLRAVGWLSRMDLETRPQLAGPLMPTPGAQCPGPLHARLWLIPGVDARAARDAELGLVAVAAGERPLVEPGHALLQLDSEGLQLTAIKPTEAGDGIIVRLLNPSDRTVTGTLQLGFPATDVSVVRLDETCLDESVDWGNGSVRVVVPARALRSFQIR